MNEKRLFRSEIFESTKNRNFGNVSINAPVQYYTLSIGISLIVSFIFVFILFGEFSEKYIVKGYLESTKGVARVYPNKNGVIAKCYIQQGETVKKGDKLFLINTSNDGIVKRSAHDVLTQLDRKRGTIEHEIQSKQKQRRALKGLLAKGYIPISLYNEKHDELVALEHQKNTVELDIINYQNTKSYIIRSPIDGVISSVTYQEGQYTNLTKPLLKILPSHADLIAQLFIPVKDSGFLQPNSKAIIRYDAYPYARFGSSMATINDISKSSLTDDEEEKPIRIGQPYYKVTAVLNKQFVTLYGTEKALQHGMTISAVIIGSKRKIWQWVLDPLYSFYGGLFI